MSGRHGPERVHARLRAPACAVCHGKDAGALLIQARVHDGPKVVGDRAVDVTLSPDEVSRLLVSLAVSRPDDILQLACAIRHSDDLAVAELGAREGEGGWGPRAPRLGRRLVPSQGPPAGTGAGLLALLGILDRMARRG